MRPTMYTVKKYGANWVPQGATTGTTWYHRGAVDVWSAVEVT